MPADVGVFDALATRNFERVLAALKTAQVICGRLGVEANEVSASYDRVR
jgi:hypothetical protein